MSTNRPRACGPATRTGAGAPEAGVALPPASPTAEGAGIVPTRAPHDPQNRNPVVTSLPHEGHVVRPALRPGAPGGAVAAVGSTGGSNTGTPRAGARDFSSSGSGAGGGSSRVSWASLCGPRGGTGVTRRPAGFGASRTAAAALAKRAPSSSAAPAPSRDP